ncbi:hypothetical protein glysoja_025500 [Glycine soja]|uniref:Uncharacterized protein n=1 Tax=Glycine soja TaxID=3848 RepID=A0A0B2QZX0_GLYSO|nr:hypothetical protein glysoja_025500 [Glycine soja]
MALLILNQEINKLQGVRKALSVLSKALDNDPSSVVLWFVYLLIYYGNLKPNEKDDMFLSALWFGSSILPQTVSDPKHLVDFVEAIMEVVPHNFPLAIVVCKLLTKEYNSDSNSASLWFWACSSLLNAILDAMPIPPEYVWVEAAELLHNSMGIETICDRFYRRALSVYPFSIMLWKSFY